MAASTSKVATYQENISMLLEKLKELSMDAEDVGSGRLFNRIEGHIFIVLFFIRAFNVLPNQIFTK